MSEEHHVRLTKEAIVGAALQIIDEEGLPALNMRHLGARLGVQAMAVYRYLPSKTALLDAIVDAVLIALPEPTGQDDWTTSVRAFFLDLYVVLTTHLNTLPLVANRLFTTETGTKTRERMLSILASAGLRDTSARRLFRGLTSLVIGFAWTEVGGYVGDLPDEEPFVRTRGQSSRPSSALTVELVAEDAHASALADLAATLDFVLGQPSRLLTSTTSAAGRVVETASQ